MDLRDALRMRPGDLVTFRLTRYPTDSNEFGLGVVREVTSAGGILVREYDSHNPTVSLDQERWVPFNRVTNHLARRA